MLLQKGPLLRAQLLGARARRVEPTTCCPAGPGVCCAPARPADPRQVVESLEEALPPDWEMVNSGGHASWFFAQMPSRAQEKFLTIREFGAIGNGIDRFAYGAVVDFALFHVEIGGNTYNWYVFTLADVAIVAGVAALLYDSFLGVPAAKAP